MLVKIIFSMLLSAPLIMGAGPLPKIVGPTEMKVGETVKLSLKGEIGDDPKSFGDDAMLARDFNDPTIIIAFVTPTKPGTFMFGIASNKDGKTMLYLFSAQVTPTVPVKPAKFTERLQAPYLVSPDAAVKEQLIDLLTTVNKKSYATREEASTALKMNALGTSLKPLRDEIAKILSEFTYTPEAFTATMNDIILSIKEIK